MTDITIDLPSIDNLKEPVEVGNWYINSANSSLWHVIEVEKLTYYLASITDGTIWADSTKDIDLIFGDSRDDFIRLSSIDITVEGE